MKNRIVYVFTKILTVLITPSGSCFSLDDREGESGVCKSVVEVTWLQFSIVGVNVLSFTSPIENNMKS